MFSKLFSSKKSQQSQPRRSREDSLNNLSQSMVALRETVNTLEKREAFLEKKFDTLLQNAKQKANKGDKKGALYELKKKKKIEQQLSTLQNKRLNLESQIMALEDAHLNAQTLSAMKTSSAALKSVVREDDLDKADDTMEDIGEAMDQIQEMNDAMAQTFGQDFDEDELDTELAELEELEADELLNGMQNVSIQSEKTNVNSNEKIKTLPSVPKKPVVSRKVIQEEKEDDELSELEAMMN